MDSPILRIFISSVSDEFRTYRKALEKELNSDKVKIHDSSKVMIYDSSKVKALEQEQLVYDGTQILIRLKDIIKEYDVVFHLIGDRTGKPGNNGIPDKDQLQRLIESEPNLLETLGIKESELAEISYTHWEAILALFYDKRLFVLIADNSVKRSSYLVDKEVIEFQKNLQDKHRERLGRIGKKKGVRPEENQIFKGKLSLAKLALRKLCNCNLLPDSVLAPSITKRSLEKHVRELKTSTAGTELPLISLEARDNRPSLFKEILNWSVPRSIRRYDSSAQGDAEGNQIPKERMVHWCMTGKSTHILIVGEAGAGKSSYLRQLAYDVCQKWNWDDWSRRDGNQKCRLPVFLRWAEVLGTLKADLWKLVEGDSDEESIEKIADRFIQLAATKISQKKDVNEWLCESASEHGIVFFLDALDEAASRLLSEKRPRSKNNSYATAEFFRLIGVLVERLATRNSIIISTTRSSAFALISPSRLDYLPNLNDSESQIETGIYELTKWNIEDARVYVKKVLGQNNTLLCDQIISRFDENRGDPEGEDLSMDSLWRDPFLLSLYCNLHFVSRLSLDNNAKSLAELYEESLKYLANSTKQKAISGINQNEAVIAIVGKFFLQGYIKSSHTTSTDWSMYEEDFDASMLKILTKRENRAILVRLGGNTKEAIKRIKHTGFFRTSTLKQENNMVSIEFSDYRIFEYLIGRAVSMKPAIKQFSDLDKVLETGTNPLILYHFASVTNQENRLIWWIATRLSTLAWDTRGEFGYKGLGYSCVDNVEIDKKFMFATTLLRHPKVRRIVQTLKTANSVNNEKTTIFNRLISIAVSKIVLQSNRNFLLAFNASLRKRHWNFFVLQRYPQLKKKADGSFIDYGVDTHYLPLFLERFGKAFIATNPALFVKKIPKKVRRFDSNSSSFFAGKTGLVRVSWGTDDQGYDEIHDIVAEDRVPFLLRRGEGTKVICEELGSEDAARIDDAYRLTFGGLLFNCVCYKFGSFIHLTDGLYPLPFAVKSGRVRHVLRGTFAGFFPFVLNWFLFFLLVITMSIFGQLICYLLLGLSVFASVEKTDIISYSVLVAVLIVYFLYGFSYRPKVLFFFNWNLNPYFDTDDSFNGRNCGTRIQARCDVDLIFEVCGISPVLMSYDRSHHQISPDSPRGDFFLLSRSRYPDSRVEFFRLLERNLDVNEHWFSDTSLSVFFSFFLEAISSGRMKIFGQELLINVFKSKQRTNAIKVLSKVLDVSISDVQRALDDEPLSSVVQQNMEKKERLLRFVNCCRGRTGEYWDEQYEKRKIALSQLESLIDEAILGDIEGFYKFLCSSGFHTDMPLDLWVERREVEGSTVRIVAALAESITNRLKHDITSTRVSLDPGFFLAFFNEVGHRFHGDKVVDFCCVLLRSGFFHHDAGQSRGLLVLIRRLPPGVRARNSAKMLNALNSYSDYFDFFGLYDSQKAVLRRAITGRSEPEVLSLKKRFLGLFRSPVYHFCFLGGGLRRLWVEWANRGSDVDEMDYR